MKRKWLAIGIILLFVGVTIAPTITFNTVKASQDDELVEVTTQACGIKGYDDTTVKLTRQQYQDLEQYLVEFRARLNQTTTREEAIPIFKEAVVELDTYGLLPKGMSVERTQKLVIGLYQNTKLIKYLEGLSKKSVYGEGNEVCLIYGEAQNNTYFLGPIRGMMYEILDILSWVPWDIPLIEFSIYLLILINVYMTLILSNIQRYSPYIWTTIFYGGTHYWPSYDFPAEGYIWTIGLNDIQNWSGQFYGRLPYLPLEGIHVTFYPGVYGFTGLRFYSNYTDFYFGFAMDVNVSSQLHMN